MDEAPRLEAKLKVALMAALAVAAAYGLGLQFYWAEASRDISVYWEAGTRMWSGETIYVRSDDPRNEVGYFIYPPFFAALFAPLTVLPRWLGYALWTGLQIGLIVFGLRLAARLCGVAHRRRMAFHTLMVVGISGALSMNLLEGQVNMLLLCVVAAGLLLLDEGRPVRGGLLLAAAAHLKVLPIVLLPLLIAQGRFKAAAAMAAGVALLWFAPLAFTVPNHGLVGGWRANVQLTDNYVDEIVRPRLDSQYAGGIGGARAPNNSLGAVARRWFGDDYRLSLNAEARSPLIAAVPEAVVKYSGLALGGVLGALAMLLAWRRRDSSHARVASVGLGLTAAGLANLLYWPHHMCLLLLVLAPLAASGFERNGARAAVMCAGGLLVFAYAPLMDFLAPFDWMGILGTPTLAVLAVFAAALIHFMHRPIAGTRAPPILPGDEETTARDPAA